MKDAPVLVCNVGIGDGLVLSGAAIKLAKIHGGLQFPCTPKNKPTIDSVFVNYPQIKVFTVDNSEKLAAKYSNSVLNCYWKRLEGVMEPTTDWPVWMYQQLSVPFQHRWTSCPIEEAANKIDQFDQFYPIVIHDDPDRGFQIDLERVENYSHDQAAYIVDNPDYPSVLSYVELLRQAQQIHVMDSWVFHLVESIWGVKAQLFFHTYVRQHHPVWHNFSTRYNWIKLI